MNATYLSAKTIKETNFGEILTHCRLVLPENLPVKVITNGQRVLINVGEAAFFPAGSVFEVNSDCERKQIDFDYSLIHEEEDLTFLLPLFSNAFILKPKAETAKAKEVKPFGFILPITATGSDKAALKDTTANLSPVDLVRLIFERVSAGDSFFFELNSKILMKTLMSMIGQEALTALYGAGEKKPTHDMVGRLSNVVRFINEHYSEQITLDDIAAAAPYTRTHLSHLYKTFYGISLFDYLNLVKSYAAGKILITEKVSTQDAFLRAGFTSSSNFNRVFKDVLGYSPRDYVKFKNYD